MKKIITVFLIFLSHFAFSKKNFVVIKGKKRSRIELKNPSSGSSFRSDEIDSQTLKTHIKMKPSLRKKEGSKITASDFTLPRVRGQHQKNTEIWLGESLIYDPWLSLPTSYTFHSRQFSRVNLYEGLSPYSIPSSNPFGILQYEKKSFKNSAFLGTKIGKPFGKGLSGQIERKTFFRENTYFSFFFSLHDTKGSYSYWDGEGTFFNKKKGKISKLQHNQQNSYFIAPFFGFDHKEISVRLYSFISKEKRELPLLTNKDQETSLSDLAFMNHLTLSWSPEAQDSTAKLDKVLLSFNHQKGTKNYKNQNYLSENNSDHFRVSFIPSWSLPLLKLQSSLAYSHSTISYDLEKKPYTVKRNAFDFYTAYQTQFRSPFNLENKYHLRFSKDSKKSSLSELNFSYSFSLFYKKRNGHLYLQFAENKRLPNLLEELGDSYFIKPSENLRAEKTRHLEFGGKIKLGKKNTLSGALYYDHSKNQIKFLPASFGKMKALNLSQTQNLGFEITHSLETKFFDMFSGASYLYSLDSSNPRLPFLVPLSSFYVLTNHMELKVNGFFTHLSHRLNGPYYYDSANTLLVNPHLIEDLAFGYQHKLKKSTLAIKISLQNLFDVKSLGLTSEGRVKRKGRLARSEFYGMPLPGRTWTLDLEAKF